MDNPASIREKLAQEIGTVDWKPLAVHAQGDKLIVVAADIDLLDAAVAVAEDDASKVTPWIEGGKLTKLTLEEQAALEQEPGTFFQFVVVAPFVLAKRVILAPVDSDQAAS